MSDSSFTYPRGTRGKRAPQGRFVAWVNRVQAGRVRKSDGPMMGMDMLVLHTVGAKSGQPRQTPVARFEDGDGRWLVVASASGAATNPAWYFNLAAHPDQVSIDLAGQSIAVAPEELHGAEYDDARQRVVARAPRFAGYWSATDRAIPIIRLTRKA